MSSDHSNHVMSSLAIDSTPTLDRFLRMIKDKISDEKTLHLFEHRNKSFSVHGHPNISTSLSLLTSNSQPQCELPSTSNHSATTPTLILDAANARNLVASALFSTGCKVIIWVVSSDGRISSSMEGTPGCPGTLSEWLGERADDGVVIAVRPVTKAGVQTIGIAVWDPMTVTLKVADIHDGHELSILETVFVAVNAREVIVPDDMIEFERLKLEDVALKCNVALTTRKKKLFDSNSNSDVLNTIARLCGNQLRNDSLLDEKVCSACTSALLEYCNINNDVGLEGKLRVSALSVVNYMLLDNCVIRALNILPFPGDGGKKASLYGLLNKCKNSMGSKLLKSWLSQPLQNIDQINARLNIVESLASMPDLLQSVRDSHLAKLPDIQMLCRKFIRNDGKKATMEDVVKLYQCSVRIPVLCAEIESCDDEEKGQILKDKFTTPLRKLCEELRNFETLVEMTIDLEKIGNGEFCVAPSIDPELGRLKSKQDEIISNITDEHDKIKYELSDTLKLERKDNLGYFFRLTRKEERMIRGKSKYIVLETRKDGVRFQTLELKKQSRKYESIAEEYSELEKEMRDKTLDVAATYVEVFIDSAALLAQLDVLCTFALVAQTSRASYIRPMMVESGNGLFIKQARHPIVEENLPDEVEYIANDIDLRRDRENSSRDNDGDENMGMEGRTNPNINGGSLALVTGPNMGGKSTYIRSAGVLTLMAHVGMYVPAEQATIPITDRIFARVGAADNQHRAVSTFMSEMLETATILKGATSKSLVIIDELGRGTGTTDGFGLAYAISKHIAHEIRCACLFATHFYELTSLANDADLQNTPSNRAVYNLHVTAVADATKNGSGGLTFLYEVRDGACDQSFGVHVAEMAKFPKEVVDGARRKAKEMELDGGNEDMHKRLSQVEEKERQKGIELLEQVDKRIKALPRGSDEEIKSSVQEIKAIRKEMEQVGNKYIDIILGIP